MLEIFEAGPNSVEYVETLIADAYCKQKGCKFSVSGSLIFKVARYENKNKYIYFSRLSYEDTGNLATLCRDHHLEEGSGKNQHNSFKLKSGNKVGDMAVSSSGAEAALSDRSVKSIIEGKR